MCTHNNCCFVLVVIGLVLPVVAQEFLANPRCNLDAERGTCDGTRGFVINWYYDRYAHRCREFYYSGCAGNENRFGTQQECEQQCRPQPTDDDPSKRCAQPHDPGTCGGNFERWYFDWRTRRCVCSWWSGCGGNSNIFYSHNHCMSICGAFAESTGGNIVRRSLKVVHYQPQQAPETEQSATMSPSDGRIYRNLFAQSRDSDRPEASDTGYHVVGTNLGNSSGQPYDRRRHLMTMHTANGRWNSHTEWYRWLNRKMEWRRRLHEQHLNPSGQLSAKKYLTVHVQRGRPAGDQQEVELRQPQETIHLQQQRIYGQSLAPESHGERQRLVQYHRRLSQNNNFQQYRQQQWYRSRDKAGDLRVQSVQKQSEQEMNAALERERAHERERMREYEQLERQYAEARARALREREEEMKRRYMLEQERMAAYVNRLRRYQQSQQATDARSSQQSKDVQLLSANSPNASYGYGDQSAAYAPRHLVPMEHRRRSEIARAKFKLRKQTHFERLKKLQLLGDEHLRYTTVAPIDSMPSPPIRIPNTVSYNENHGYQMQQVDQQHPEQKQEQQSVAEQPDLNQQIRGDLMREYHRVQQEAEQQQQLEQQRQQQQLFEWRKQQQKQESEYQKRIEQQQQQHQQEKLNYEKHIELQKQQQSDHQKHMEQQKQQQQTDYQKHMEQQKQQQQTDYQKHIERQQQHQQQLQNQLQIEHQKQYEQQQQQQQQQQSEYENDIEQQQSDYQKHIEQQQQQHQQQLQNQPQDEHQKQYGQQQQQQEQQQQYGAHELEHHEPQLYDHSSRPEQHPEDDQRSYTTGMEHSQENNQQEAITDTSPIHDRSMNSSNSNDDVLPLAVIPAEHLRGKADGVFHTEIVTAVPHDSGNDYKNVGQFVNFDDYDAENAGFTDGYDQYWSTLEHQKSKEFGAQASNAPLVDGETMMDHPTSVPSVHESKGSVSKEGNGTKSVDDQNPVSIKVHHIDETSAADRDDSEEAFFWRPLPKNNY